MTNKIVVIKNFLENTNDEVIIWQILKIISLTLQAKRKFTAL